MTRRTNLLKAVIDESGECTHIEQSDTVGQIIDAINELFGQQRAIHIPGAYVRQLCLHTPIAYKGYLIGDLSVRDFIEFPLELQPVTPYAMVVDMPDAGPLFVWQAEEGWFCAYATEESYEQAVDNARVLTWLDAIEAH